jgi:hypothetical protein
MILFLSLIAALAVIAFCLLVYELAVWRDHLDDTLEEPDAEANSRPLGNVVVLREHERGGS